MTENGKNTNNNVSYPRLKTGACESSDGPDSVKRSSAELRWLGMHRHSGMFIPVPDTADGD